MRRTALTILLSSIVLGTMTPAIAQQVEREGRDGDAATAELHAPLPQMRLPSEPFAESDCIEGDDFAQQREAFIEMAVPDASVYIRRVDVTLCGYEPSRELMTYLNSLPEIRDGLEHMLIDLEQIVSAAWTDDAGLLIYTVDPASILDPSRLDASTNG